MSHPYPDRGYQSFDSAFHHEPHPYPGSLPRLHVSTAEQAQQWNPSPRPRSVQDTVDPIYSPAASVHTTRTTPDALLLDGMTGHHPDASRANNCMTFGLQNDPSMLYPSYISPTLNPSAQDESWSALNLRSAQNNRAMRYPSHQSNIDFSQYSTMGSDAGKSVLPSDEGYMSVRTSQSVLDNDPDRVAQTLPMDLLSKIGNMNVDSVTSGATAVSYAQSDQRSHVSSTRSRKPKNQSIKCDHVGCNEILKNHSEYRKHQLKHEKPFRCNAPNCKRAHEGFTSVNDLDRHKKTVHQIDHDKKSYKCVGKNCKNSDKVWPRLDNFKQHVQRLHRDEDEADIIERSKLRPENYPSFTDDESTVAQMDTSSVLAGMDKSLPFCAVANNSLSLEPSSQHNDQRCPPYSLNLESRKEEHQRSRFPDQAPFATQSAHAQRRAPGLSSAQQSQTPAPGRTTSQAPPLSMDHVLSSAPQTKAEQQRVARKRSVAVPSPTGSADIDHILTMLQQANGSAKRGAKSAGKARPGPSTESDTDAVILTKRDALEIVKLIKQSSEGAQAAPRRTGRGAVPRQRVCPHDGCEHTAMRDCDMRKHMKRHEKPYGCTYPKCHKRFGAKSDWKRHENSQHFQPEGFRCAYETSSGAVCGQYLHRQGMFQTHMKTHGVSTPKASEDLMKRSRIGKNRLETFWCGFCRIIVQLKTRRNAAWDERFDHIAHHLEKEKKSIEGWLCAEQNKTKKELLEESSWDAWGDDDDKDKDDDAESAEEEERDDDSPQQPQYPPPPPSPPPDRVSCAPVSTRAAMPQPLSQSPGRQSSRKRAAPSDSDHSSRKSKQKRMTTKKFLYCCSCNRGPCGSMETVCLNCEHVLCGNCNVVNEEFVMGPTELYD